ncbi:hypothetical protein [Brachyspira hyodysenteriae]|uniref:hypothetical protein n=1 Tax=Brachyspira hyodysenteriae TaxID=159 RepID=UPI0022CE0F93|nr:hypothetical protein [Brachyspira hyodysenteriae]MCZ9888981.1 hypothetical protein [Brachyspira hyodysenteriae]
MIPYIKRGEKTYKDNKYYYIYFYKTLIVKLDLNKLQEIWDYKNSKWKRKSFGYLRFALGGFGKYIDYALEYYYYFVLGIKPKEI